MSMMPKSALQHGWPRSSRRAPRREQWRACAQGAKRRGSASARIRSRTMLRRRSIRRPTPQPAARSSRRLSRWPYLWLFSVWMVSPALRRRSAGPSTVKATSRERLQVHLDPAQHRRSRSRLVAEGVDRDVAVELAVDPVEEVEVERGGDPGGVVIGGEQHVDVLDPVHADQQPRARRRASPSSRAAGRPRCAATKLPIVEPGKKPSLGSAAIAAGKLERPHEIGLDRMDRQGRETRPASAGARSRAGNRPRCRSAHRRAGLTARSRIGVLVDEPEPNSTTALAGAEHARRSRRMCARASAVSVRVG